MEATARLGPTGRRAQASVHVMDEHDQREGLVQERMVGARAVARLLQSRLAQEGAPWGGQRPGAVQRSCSVVVPVKKTVAVGEDCPGLPGVVRSYRGDWDPPKVPRGSPHVEAT